MITRDKLARRLVIGARGLVAMYPLLIFYLRHINRMENLREDQSKILNMFFNVLLNLSAGDNSWFVIDIDCNALTRNGVGTSD